MSTPLATLTLSRVKQNDYATWGGIWNEDGIRECTTLELPYKNNAHDVSCIPATIDAHGNRVRPPYTAERYLSPDHNDVVFRLIDVPDRGYIEMHAGCLPSDSKGCILLGSVFGAVDYGDGRKGDGQTGARTAFQRFMLARPEQRFLLEVEDPRDSLPQPERPT